MIDTDGKISLPNVPSWIGGTKSN